MQIGRFELGSFDQSCPIEDGQRLIFVGKEVRFAKLLEGAVYVHDGKSGRVAKLLLSDGKAACHAIGEPMA